jgi:hypothetical protein
MRQLLAPNWSFFVDQMVNSREWVNIIDGLNKKPMNIAVNRKEIHWDSGGSA